MAPSMNDLPDEILDCIIEGCDTKELLDLARSSKRLSRLASMKLYRHIYYRHVERQEGGYDTLSD